MAANVTYLFRIDDISWDMNYENFARIRDIFLSYNVRPIVGVIPCNKDEKLKRQAGVHTISEEQFWQEIRELQQKNGWAIALHGYDHVYITEDSGIFRTNKRAEFAGAPYEVQAEKIRKGKQILEENGLHIDAFMAPAHSLDWNTVEALKENGIRVITDGIALYPYYERGVLFIPQIWHSPRKASRGVFTICLHINEWEKEDFEGLEKYIKENQACIGTFQAIITLAASKTEPHWNRMNRVARVIIPAQRKLRSIASNIKHRRFGSMCFKK